MKGFFPIVLTLCAVIGKVVSIDVEQLLQSMSIEDKIGQMVQLDIQKFLIQGTDKIDYTMMEEWIIANRAGSMLNCVFSGGPIDGKTGWNATEWREFIINMQTISQKLPSKVPLIYGLDSIHGATYVKDAALFPQSLGAAASFDRSHVKNMGIIAAKDTRAAGIPWLFAPVLGLGLHPLWSRFAETFGEDMYLAAEMGVAAITGMQDVVEDGGIPRQAAACMKHFIAYSDPENGHDRSPVMLPDRTLRQLYVPQFKAAVEAGVLTAMESYNEVGGVPMVSSADYLKTLLRQELNFTGMMVTDYAEIENLHNWHKVSATQRDAVKLSMQDTSIDMSMVPNDDSFYTHLLSLVQSGEIDESRVDESARRILKLKDQLGLFDVVIPPLEDPNIPTVGQDEDWEKATDAARGSITLVQNNAATLPRPLTDKVFVSGPTCDSLPSQSGGWSLHWQGAWNNSEFSRGVTIVDGIRAVFTGETDYYAAGPTLSATDLSAVDMDYVLGRVSLADSVVICVGEGTYEEKPGDIDDLALPQGQVDFVTAIQASIAASATPDKTITLVIVSGRPRLLHDAVVASSAVLNAYLPGPMGGQAVAEILGGVVVPSGRQPYTYPRHAGDIPYAYHHKPGDMCIVAATGGYINCEVEWQFGHGLSYTSFVYSDLTLSSTEVNEDGKLIVTVNVQNTGAIAAEHSVLLFLYDIYRRVTPEYKLLKKFSKQSFAAGEKAPFSWTLDRDDFQYVGVDSRYVLEAGEFYVGIGADVDCRTSDTTQQQSMYGGAVMCSPFNLTLSETYNPVCEYACALWGNGLCGVTVSASDCEKQCVSEAWSWNYVDCLQQYDKVDCSGSEAVQCYDAFSMNVPSDDNYSKSFVLTLFLVTLFVSLLLGAALSFCGYRYINNQSLSKPLLGNYGKVRTDDKA